MRCESLQGVWSPEAQLVHEVLEVLFIDEPSSIWSGASDGKLVRWSLDSEEAWAFGLLCGHTNSIVGLATCSPSSSSAARAVVSVCLDGGICLWDIITGRCFKRRKLSLSAAHPAAIATVPGAQNCVCVAYNSSSGPEGEADTNSKGGVLLVDVNTFTVLQTLSLALGPISAIVAATQDSEHGVIVADRQGRSRSWWGIKLEQEGETGKNVRPHGTPWDLEQGTAAESVALSSSARYMLLVFKKHWLVGSRWGGSGFAGKSDCNAGGCFLSASSTQPETFLIWDVHGGATIYTLTSHRQSVLEARVICCIPPPPTRTGIGVRFCSVSDGAVARLEFGCPGKSSLWGARVTLWNTSNGSCLSNQEAEQLEEWRRKEEVVSTSMVLSNGKWQVPSAIVYGYETGTIQVVELLPATEVASKRNFLWHSGPVLCLAAHYPESEQQILLSGSMDCCVCIWDMKAGNLLTVLHQHVAPIRQLILPSPETIGPWAQCFISVSEDGCVAISSLSTLRTERMFPGHPGVIKRAVWDETRGYLAVLCTAGSGNDLLYIWDVHSGCKERVLRSAAAHSMLKHFLSRRKLIEQVTSISPSTSSLLLPYDEHIKPSSPRAKLQTGDKAVKRLAVRGGCPFPGVAAIQLDMSIVLMHKSGSHGTIDTQQEEQLLRTNLSILHVWGLDELLDGSISRELLVHRPKDYQTGAGVLGSKGAVSLVLPSKRATFELWRIAPEFCSLRVLTMVSLAQLLISISNPGSLICSALATFYSKTIFEKLGANFRPFLEVYIHFWQDPAEHVRLAARTLFHTAAENGIPDLLRNDIKLLSPAGLLDWLESMDVPEWAAASGASYQDARAARIVMCGALVVWYPEIVREDLAEATAPLLLKLVQATSDKHSATAAEILSAGMAKAWQPLMNAGIPHLIRDVLSLAQCLNAGDDTSTVIRNGLTTFLLPSLAGADVLSFLSAVRSSAAMDPSAYLIGLPAIVQVVQKAPLVVIPFLGQVVALALQGLDIAKPASLKDKCFSVSFQTIRELVRAFPMVALYEDPVSPVAKLAVGDPIGDVQSLAIHVYDLPSGTKVKLLDASGPPGHPALSRGGTSGITAASFSRNGEGMVAFSHRGLIIRWWSFEGNWWERLSRGPLLVQCTKVVFVPPSAAFSPRSSSTSIISVLSTNQLTTTTTTTEEEADSQAIDLSFRLEWKSDRAVALHRGAEEVGIFHL